jgi:hypothetical protein
MFNIFNQNNLFFFSIFLFNLLFILPSCVNVLLKPILFIIIIFLFINRCLILFLYLIIFHEVFLGNLIYIDDEFLRYHVRLLKFIHLHPILYHKGFLIILGLIRSFIFLLNVMAKSMLFLYIDDHIFAENLLKLVDLYLYQELQI